MLLRFAMLLCAAPPASALVLWPTLGRRRALLLPLSLGLPLPASAEEDNAYIRELLRRTDENRAANEEQVRRATQLSGFTAIEGTVSEQLVKLDGRYALLDAKSMEQLRQQGRLRCYPGEACRVVDIDPNAAPLSLPSIKSLVCDDAGRNCKFRDL